jgi:hypothetical protein
MNKQHGLSYRFARPYPTDKAMFRVFAVVLLPVIGGAIALWAVGTLPLSDASWVGGTALTMLLAGLLFSRVFARSKGRIVLAPSALLIEEPRLFRYHEYPFEDVASLSLETSREFGLLNRFFWRVMYGPESNRPYVKIRVSRSVRYSVGGARMGTRILGVPMPGFKTLRIFLQEPSRFVNDAQQLLQGRRSPEG